MDVLYYEVHVTYEHSEMITLFDFWTSVVDKEPDEEIKGKEWIATRRFKEWGDAVSEMHKFSNWAISMGAHIIRNKIEATVYDTKKIKI